MRLWRLVRARHAASAFDSEGAARFPGRWNLRGVRMVYLASSPALAALEVLGLTRAANAPNDYRLIVVELPGETPKPLDPLPENWSAEPPAESTQEIGSAWISAASSLLLAVPSVHLPTTDDVVVLFSPKHPDATHLRIVDNLHYAFDLRVLSNAASREPVVKIDPPETGA